MTTLINSSQSELNQKLRAYAERMPVEIVQPSSEEAIAAIKPYFPELMGKCNSIQDLLDKVGLLVITDISQDYKPKRISWSIVDNKAEADRELEKYIQAPFTAIREQFGINYHWVFLVPSQDLLWCTDEQLIEGSGDFRCDGMPECWILDRFH